MNIAKAIIARQDGDNKQALRFCIEACRMFHEHTHVVEVGFEMEDCRGFDDIMVEYSPAVTDGRGERTRFDHFQVKHRVLQGGQITATDLTDPAFIHATRESLLQKVHRLRGLHSGEGLRLILDQPRSPAPGDELCRLVDSEGRIRLDVLFEGGPKSNTGKLRRHWLDHLEIEEDELRQTLAPLRLPHKAGSMEALREELNASLLMAGFKPVDAGQLNHPYVSIVWRQYGDRDGPLIFNRAQFEQLMRENKLYVGPPVAPTSAHRIGIRSFEAHTGYFAEELDSDPCCFLQHFEARVVRDPALWKSHIKPGVAEFLGRELRPRRKVHLALETHFPIAFLTGYLAARSGAEVVPLQQGAPWAINRPQHRPFEKLWDFRSVQEGDGQDIVVAVSVSQITVTAVVAATAQLGLGAAQIIEARVLPEPGRTAILNADHAFLLSKELVDHLLTMTASRPGVRFHIFAAVPTALSYMIGEAAYVLGQIELYDFHPGERRYVLTLSLP